MKNGISFRQYRAIDLGLFAAILLVSQFLIVKAAGSWFAAQRFIVSPAAAVVAIVMMRWGPWAAIHAVLSGLLYCLQLKGGWQQYAAYIAGNLCAMVGLAQIQAHGKEAIRGSTSKTLIFATVVQVSMLLGRAFTALVVGLENGDALLFITTDALSLVFTLVILWIARRVDGLFEDQKHYLFRIQREAQAEAAGQALTDGESTGRGTY